MLENFAVGARCVVSQATVEARRLDHSRVGTEHLLLGLLSEDDTESANVLRSAGVSLAAARHKVAEALGAGIGSPDGEALPFTSRAQRALERAGRFSRKSNESEVSAGHVLLGVLDVEGLACQVLRGLGVDIVQIRLAVDSGRVDVPDAVADDAPMLEAGVEAAVEAVQPRCPNCHAPLHDTLTEMLVPARREGAATREVNVAFCAACGTALGVVRRS